MLSLKDKVAIITGAGSGFGEAIAKQFSQQGATVAILDLNLPAAERVASEIGGKAMAVQVDVGDFDAVQNAVAQVCDQLGTVNILVNNAGVTHKNMPMLDVDEASFDQVFRVNVKSIFNFSHAVIPMMREQKSGVILNIGSVAGIRPDRKSVV